MTESTEGPKCPYCGTVHGDDLGDVVSYWGTDVGKLPYTCEACDEDFWVIELVTRSWESLKGLDDGE